MREITSFSQNPAPPVPSSVRTTLQDEQHQDIGDDSTSYSQHYRDGSCYPQACWQLGKPRVYASKTCSTPGLQAACQASGCKGKQVILGKMEKKMSGFQRKYSYSGSF